MKKIIIAIDGLSACGKSSTAKSVAANLGYAYIDSGAMYRAVTLYFHNHFVNLTNENEVTKALSQIDIDFKYSEKNQQNETYLNGLNVEKEIRKMYVTEKVSEVSTHEKVRKAMVAQQQKMAKKRGIVMDGRDIGSVVFPDAELKIFMTADFYIRSERRQKELLEKNEMVDLNTVMENLQKRDHIDSTRKESPLIKVPEAIEIDTTHYTLTEQVDAILALATSKIVEKNKEIQTQELK